MPGTGKPRCQVRLERRGVSAISIPLRYPHGAAAIKSLKGESHRETEFERAAKAWLKQRQAVSASGSAIGPLEADRRIAGHRQQFFAILARYAVSMTRCGDVRRHPFRTD